MTTCRYDPATSARITRITPVMGSTNVKGASPAYGSNSIRISAVPYALDEIASVERTPSATGFDSRSDLSCSVISGLPRTSRFSEYPTDSGVVDRPTPDVETTHLLCQPPGSSGRQRRVRPGLRRAER